MKRISRRGLLASGAAAGILAAGGLAHAGQAARGGRLRIALSGAHAADSWDSRRFHDLFMIAAGQGCVFDCLTEVAADGSLRGELAQSWDVTPDARVWTVTLRRGVTFHNGKPFTAEDVLASFALHRTASLAAPLVAPIEEIAALSPHRVRFTLREGNADFPYILSDYHLVIYPADNLPRAMAQGIGTGLYRVDRFEPGRALIARRVDQHYKDGQAGWADRIELHAVADPRAQAAGLIAGRFDAADLVTQSPDDTVQIAQAQGNRHLAYDLRGLDEDMRTALRLGVDRAASAGEGGWIGADSPFGPANAYFDPALAPQHDPDRARWHLARSATPVSVPGLALALPQAAVAVPAQRCYGRATEDWMLSALAAQDRLPQAAQALQPLARAERDSGRRAALYRDIQAILATEGNALVPAFEPYRSAVRRSVGMPAVTGNLYPMDSARFAERWWRV
ncbi:MAG: peptide ABC transporter substrate-binding protein [Roseivivax sp.]|nr:peptide ABC transporter substrate-binding protein [Roseivivax sp.]